MALPAAVAAVAALARSVGEEEPLREHREQASPACPLLRGGADAVESSSHLSPERRMRPPDARLRWREPGESRHGEGGGGRAAGGEGAGEPLSWGIGAGGEQAGAAVGCGKEAGELGEARERVSQQYFSLTTNQPPATSRNQPAVLFSQNKPAPAIGHQPTEQARSTYATVLVGKVPSLMAIQQRRS
jgi:hypothetical protein